MPIIPTFDGEIISRELIENKARTAFFAGLPRDAHQMNWHAAGRVTWLDAYDRCAAQYNQNSALAGGRVDAYHGSEP